MTPKQENKINELLMDQEIYQELALLMQKYNLPGLPTPESLDNGIKQFGGIFARELKMIMNPNANTGGEGDNSNVNTTDGDTDTEDTSKWWQDVLGFAKGGLDIWEDYKDGPNDGNNNNNQNNNQQNAGIDQKTLLMIAGGFVLLMFFMVILMKGGK